MFENVLSVLPYFSTMCFLLAIYGYKVKIKKIENEVNSLKKRL